MAFQKPTMEIIDKRKSRYRTYNWQLPDFCDFFQKKAKIIGL